MTKSDTAHSPETAARLHLALQSGLLLALFLLAPNAPRPSVAFPFLWGAVSIAYFVAVAKRPRGILEVTEERWFLAALFTFAGYLFLNALWSLDTPAGLGKAALMLCMIVLTLLVTRALSRQSRETLHRCARLAVIGAVAGTLIAGFEFSSGHQLASLVYETFPALRPGDKTIDVLVPVGGEMMALPESQFSKDHAGAMIKVETAALNRNLSLLLLLFWPAIFFALHSLENRPAWLAAGVIAGTGTVTISVAESQTAQVAIVVSATVFFLARVWPTFTRRGLLGVWCIVVMLAIPLAAAPQKAGLHAAEWLPNSFRDRMIIWSTTAEQTARAPWLGIGIRATRVLGKELKKEQSQPPGYIKPKRLGLHAHNHFLQVWFELGLAGALFVLALGIGLLRAIDGICTPVRPYACAAFATALVISAFGWGLWQSWLMSGYALTIMLTALADAYAGSSLPRRRDL